MTRSEELYTSILQTVLKTIEILKMKILKMSEYCFGVTGILVLNENCSTKILAFIQNFLFAVFLGPFLTVTSVAFIYYNRDNFDDCFTSFATIFVGTMITGKYSSLKFEEKRIKKLIDTFQETVDEGFCKRNSLCLMITR